MTTKSYLERITVVGGTIGATGLGLIAFLIFFLAADFMHMPHTGALVTVGTVAGVVLGTFLGDLILLGVTGTPNSEHSGLV